MAAEAASLPVLPVEIMEFVVGHMADDGAEGSLANLAQTCRGFHAIVMPRLYNKQTPTQHPALIFWAAHLGRIDTARRLLEVGVDLNRAMIRNETFPSVLARLADYTPRQQYQQFYAIINPSIGTHDGVLRVGPRGFVGDHFGSRPVPLTPDAPVRGLPTLRWHSWWSPIHLAVRDGFTDLVELFLSKGAQLGVSSGSFCRCKYMAIVSYYSYPNDRPLWTPLHTAICTGHYEIAMKLLQHGASVSLESPGHPFTVLHQAASAGSIDLVNFVLDNNYQNNVQAPDHNDLSPIWHAYSRGHWDVIDNLLARGANIDDDLATGYTPLVDACFFGNFIKAMKLIDRGADVNMTCTAHPTQLSSRRVGVMQQLECLRGHRPIDLCCLKQQAMVRPLRYQPPPPGPPLIVGHHPPPPPPAAGITVPKKQHVPDEQQRLNLITRLLDAGADMGPGKHSPTRAPPLVAAAAQHLVEVVRLLLDRGAPVDCTDKEGTTALMATMSYGIHWCRNHSKVGPLSSRPFALQRPDRAVDVPTVPTRAKANSCRQGDNFLRCVELLLGRGANPMATNNFGVSPLILLYSPAMPTGQEFKSDRPRGHLTFKERAKVVSILIGLGCDPNTSVTPRAPDDLDSDAENDNFSAYSGSSDTSRDTSTGSDDNSSTRSRIRRVRPRSLRGFGPMSILQCAFWDGDVDLCRTLLKAGAKLDTNTVAWMLYITWGYCRYRMRSASEQLLQVLGDLDVDVQTKLASHPLCLMVLLHHKIWDLAHELLPTIEVDLYKEIPKVGQYNWLFDRESDIPECVSWGTICLTEAIHGGSVSIVQALLLRNMDPNTPELDDSTMALTRAIDRGHLEMIELLIRNGAHVQFTDSTDERVKKGNPLINAIRREDANTIGAILREQKDKLESRFSWAYLREAYMIRSPKSLNTLLTFPCMDVHGRSPDEPAETHLTDLIENIIPICDYVSYDIEDEDIIPWAISIRTKLERVRLWMECLIILAKANIDPRQTNGQGQSGLELFGNMIKYQGRDRFKTHVRSVLRTRLSEVMGEQASEEGLEAGRVWDQLKICKVDLAESSAASTASTGTSGTGITDVG